MKEKLEEGKKITISQKLSKLVISELKAEIPTQYELSQNYPNPFNPSTRIRFGLPAASHVTLRVFNVLGQVVDELVNETRDAGYYVVDWKPMLANGVYFYRLDAQAVESGSHFSETKRLILLK